jgi:hypothetical protein
MPGGQARLQLKSALATVTLALRLDVTPAELQEQKS